MSLIHHRRLALRRRPSRVVARQRPLSRLLATAVLASGLAWGVTAAAPTAAAPAVQQSATLVNAADEGPPALETVTAQPLPTWQTNGVVYAVETVGNVVYAGGNFTRVRPPGAAPGQQEVARKNLAAFNATTGELLSFSHTFRAPDYAVPTGGAYDQTCSPGSTAATYTCDTVYEVRASRDGTRIFVGGDFTQVDGQARGNLAAFATSGGALSSWRVTGVAGRVRALTVTGDTVYFGGSFTRAGTAARNRLAAADAATGAVLPWAPSADRLVIAMAMAESDSRVVIGGQFDTVNGQAIHGLAAVSATGEGASVRWDSRPIPPTSYVTDLSVDGGTVFASANGEGGGVFDGRLAAVAATGEIVWQDVCLGATWAIEVAGPLVYSGSHAHDCSRTSGGFPEAWFVSPPAIPRYYRLLAQTKDGQYAPHIQHWFPTTNGGIVGKLGPRDLSWTGQQLWVAGEFTTVNNVAQQGLTRFGFLPSATSAAPLRPDAPTAASARPGEVRVSLRATEDIDDESLTYTVLRGPSTGAMAPVGTVNARSKPWQRPSVRFTDTGLTPGATYVYQVQAVDPHGRTSPRSFASSVTVATSVDPYTDAVLDSDPALFWRLDDPAGATSVTPVVGQGGTPGSGATFGVPGAVAEADPGDTSLRTNGTTEGTVGTQVAETAPDVFSVETWFRAAAGASGKIVGFGNAQLARSTNYDRHVYVRPDGRLQYGVYPGGVRTVTSARSYTDGRWHHLVASLGTSGMRLYVDGGLVASRADVTTGQAYAGYWRLGGDSLDGWPDVASQSFTGEVDELAVYDRELSAAEVLTHRAAGSADTAPPTTPQITGGGAGGTTVALTWSAAEDDVAVARYEVHRLASSGSTTSAATRVATTSASLVRLTGQPVGTGYWRVVAVDTAGNSSAASPPRTVQVVGPRPQREAVLADDPSLYWLLDDPAGTTAVTALVGADGDTASGAQLGVAGAPDNGTAARTDGTPAGTVASRALVDGPQAFTTEAWFRTTSNQGGKIIGFSNQRTGGSSAYDRHTYMLDDGRLVFGVWLGFPATVTSPGAYNDGAWHHVSSSIGPDGQRLMVDGQVVATSASTGAQDYQGYWRIGGDTTWGGASSHYVAADIDEVAVFDRQLSVADVAGHVTPEPADTTPPSVPTGLVAAYSDPDVTLTWSGSTDGGGGPVVHEVHRGPTADFTADASTLLGTTSTATFTDPGRPPGTWHYAVVAVDEFGNRSARSATESVVINTTPVEVTLEADADAWVDSTQPTRNYGGAWALTSDASPAQQAHLRFVLPAAPTGRTLTGAVLRLSTTASSFAGSAGAAAVHLASASWAEAALTWDTRPPLGPSLGQMPPGTVQDTTYPVTLDAAGLVTPGGGPVDLVVATTSADAVQLVSSEGAAALRPQLILTWS